MASSMMDILMLGVIGIGGYVVLKNCTGGGTCFGINDDSGNTGCKCPTGQGCRLRDNSCYTFPVCGTGKIDDGNGTCVSDTTNTGGNDQAKCKKTYGGSCSGECGAGTKCTSSACKNCTAACGASKAPAACSGNAQPGSQCGNLCNVGQCLAQWNQCANNCSNGKCSTTAAFNAIVNAARTAAPAYNIECGRYSNPVGARCRACRKCPNGAIYCGARESIGGKSAGTVVNNMLATWRSAHPAGCPGGCTRSCPSGYVLDKGACACVCNVSAKGCTAGNKCLFATGTNCSCISTGSSPCNGSSSQHSCRGSNGLCSCCKNTTPPPTSGTCCQGNKCTNLTGASCCAWRASNGGCPAGQHGGLAPGKTSSCTGSNCCSCYKNTGYEPNTNYGYATSIEQARAWNRYEDIPIAVRTY